MKLINYETFSWKDGFGQVFNRAVSFVKMVYGYLVAEETLIVDEKGNKKYIPSSNNLFYSFDLAKDCYDRAVLRAKDIIEFYNGKDTEENE